MAFNWSRTYLAPPRQGPGNRPRGMTVDQWAKRQAAQIIGARVKAIQEAQRLFMEEINQQADRDRAKYDSLARNLQAMNFPGAIQGIYGGAAGNQRGLAGSLAAAAAGTVNDQAAQNQNMVSGTGQEGSLAGIGGILGEVVDYESGAVPAAAYGDIGKAFAAQAALEPGFALQIGYGDVMEAKNEQMKGLKDFLLQIAEARAERPGLRMELASARREEIAAARDAKFDQYMKRAALAQAMGKDREAEMWKRRAYALDLRKEKRYEMSAQGLTPDGRLLPGFRWRDPNDHSKGTVRIGSSKSGGPAYTPQEIRVDISTDVEGFYDEVKNPDDPLEPPIRQPWPYAKAFRTLWAKYKGTLPANKLRRIINEILAAAGITAVDRDGEGPGR